MLAEALSKNKDECLMKYMARLEALYKKKPWDDDAMGEHFITAALFTLLVMTV